MAVAAEGQVIAAVVLGHGRFGLATRRPRLAYRLRRCRNRALPRLLALRLGPRRAGILARPVAPSTAATRSAAPPFAAIFAGFVADGCRGGGSGGFRPDIRRRPRRRRLRLPWRTARSSSASAGAWLRLP